MNTIYGYVRVSTPQQKVERQEANIKQRYQEAALIVEKYTGTTMERPAWKKLLSIVKPGDTIVFDEVSRMSRTVQEGFESYLALYEKNVHLVFLKEEHLNTDVFKKALQSNVQLTGTDVDIILEGVNKYLMVLARRQIEIAFQAAENEVEYLHTRTREGIARARLEGKQIGRARGAIIETKKARIMKEKIKKMSKTFHGNLSDKEIIEILGVARNTYYKYKGQIKNEYEKVYDGIKM